MNYEGPFRGILNLTFIIYWVSCVPIHPLLHVRSYDRVNEESCILVLVHMTRSLYSCRIRLGMNWRKFYAHTTSSRPMQSAFTNTFYAYRGMSTHAQNLLFTRIL